MPTAQKTRTFTSYIQGRWLEGTSSSTLENHNPATGETLGVSHLVGREQMDHALEAAHQAFEEWRHWPAPKRADLLWRAWNLMQARRQELAQALHLEEGKLLPEAVGEVQKTLNLLEFVAGEGRRLGGQTLPSEMSSTFCYTVRQPLGVVGLITPWNFPLAIPVWKAAPALVAGNTVVLKPASNTPWTASLLTEIFVEAGFPAGVFNLVLGSGSQLGQALLEHRRTKAISFTGSTEVGQALYRQAAARGLKFQAEMGGKNPLVILEDADLDLAVEATVQGAFGSSGQRCTATSRAIVVDSVAEVFLEKLLARTAQLKLGKDLGPLVDRSQLLEVKKAIELAQTEGAQLLIGGRISQEPGLEHGNYLEPTVLAGVDRHSRLAQEEVFGPVLAVLRVADLEEALEVANDVPFGLSSSIYSRDHQRIFRFLERIETGITHVNSPTTGGEAQLPFGGMKATGIGPREQGSTAIEFYTELKTVYIDYTGQLRQSKIY